MGLKIERKINNWDDRIEIKIQKKNLNKINEERKTVHVTELLEFNLESK